MAAQTTGLFERLAAAHRELLQQLETLRALVDLLDGALDAAARQRADSLLAGFGGALRAHHLDEESRVFPALLASGEPDLLRMLHRLELDHLWIEEDWRAIAPALDAARRGLPLAGLDALRLRADRFEALCLDHMMLEDALAYPEARARLTSR